MLACREGRKRSEGEFGHVDFSFRLNLMVAMHKFIMGDLLFV